MANDLLSTIEELFADATTARGPGAIPSFPMPEPPEFSTPEPIPKGKERRTARVKDAFTAAASVLGRMPLQPRAMDRLRQRQRELADARNKEAMMAYRAEVAETQQQREDAWRKRGEARRDAERLEDREEKARADAAAQAAEMRDFSFKAGYSGADLSDLDLSTQAGMEEAGRRVRAGEERFSAAAAARENDKAAIETTEMTVAELEAMINGGVGPDGAAVQGIVEQLEGMDPAEAAELIPGLRRRLYTMLNGRRLTGEGRERIKGLVMAHLEPVFRKIEDAVGSIVPTPPSPPNENVSEMNRGAGVFPSFGRNPFVPPEGTRG